MTTPKQTPDIFPTPSRHSPTKEEMEEPIHLPGPSPDAVAKVVMRGGASRQPTKTAAISKGEASND